MSRRFAPDWARAFVRLRRPVRHVLAVAFVLAVPGFARAAEPVSAIDKLDPSLRAVAATGKDSVSVWVTFRDKGEQGLDDLAARLSRAEQDLSPRARARRVRAGVRPLVDALDLPVESRYLAALEGRGLRPLAVSRWLNRAAVRLPASRLEEIASLEVVIRISPVSRARRSEGPSFGRAVSPRSEGLGSAAFDYGKTTAAIAQMGVSAVHDSGYVGAGVLICVLDDGFPYHDTHEALSGQTIEAGRTRDFVDGDLDVTDGFGHGTAVLSLIAGALPGTILGTAFGAEFALARTEDDFGEDPVEMLFWGMGAEWADSLGADVITSSVGYFDFDGTADDYTYADMNGHTTDVTRAAEIAASKGILIVNAVGNSGANAWHYLMAPADVHGDSLIAVGAVDAAGNPAAFSSFGPSADGRIKPDLVARGVNQEVALPTSNPSGYTTASGTSISAPLVAGLAACLLQARPSWTPRDVIIALRSTASRFNAPDNQVGYGIPNGLAALRWPPPPFTPAGKLGIQLFGSNPFKVGEGTRVRVALGSGAPPGTLAARADILDASGRLRRKLWSGPLTTQDITLHWDGRDDDGLAVPPGLYWIALQGGGETTTVRVVALK